MLPASTHYDEMAHDRQVYSQPTLRMRDVPAQHITPFQLIEKESNHTRQEDESFDTCYFVSHNGALPKMT